MQTRTAALAAGTALMAVLLGVTPAAWQQAGQETDAFVGGAHRITEADVVAPVLVKQHAPRYTSEAMRAKIQGVVIVEAVIAADGAVARTRIKESLDAEYGLDANALEAIHQWEFKPGTYKSDPAAILVELKIEYRLH